MKVRNEKVSKLQAYPGNPRVISKHDFESLKNSIKEYGIVEPLVINKKLEVIGGNMRLVAIKELGFKEAPIFVVDIPKEKEKLLNLALNRIHGDWDEKKLSKLIAELDKQSDVDLALSGFGDKEIDDLLEDVSVDIPETFDLAKEVKKASVKIRTKTGDLYQLGNHRLLCGDSTKEKDMLRLMGGEKADFCFTDPPYAISYLKGGKRHGTATIGFGAKQNRRYLTTETAPKFADWLKLVHQVAKRDFNIIVFENWKNTVHLWQEMEKHWKIKNMIIWHLTNRCQGFAGKMFFNKYDIALLGTTGKDIMLNKKPEIEEIENEYKIALYAIGGKAYFDAKAMKGKYFASDHVEFKASDAKSSGQSIIFGTKPVEILIPYMKILSKKGDIILEPFGGSGSTMMTAEKLQRRCFVMEKTPLYTDVIIARWEKYTGKKVKRINA